MAAERHEFIIEGDVVGRRLDQAIAASVADLSRTRARVVIDLGGVFVDGKRTKVAGRIMRKGEAVTVNVGGALQRATKDVGRTARTQDEARLPKYEVLYEDEELVVVDKPAGLLTAPTPESDRGNLQGLLERRGRGRSRTRVYVVHRLDLGTSGVLVFAKTPHANRELSERFRTHDLEREYLCIVEGVFPDTLACLDTPIAGRSAVTHVRVVERFGERATGLRCRLHTGRTHQIRIHCERAGHPVVGDAEHGGRAIAAPRMALHATRLRFVHPRSGETLEFESGWPPDLQKLLASLRG